MLASRPEPLIYDAWTWELQRGLLAARLGGELFYDMASPNVPLLVPHPARPKPDLEVRRPQDAGPRRAATTPIATALDRALTPGSAQPRGQRASTACWQWGSEHAGTVHRHPMFDADAAAAL